MIYLILGDLGEGKTTAVKSLQSKFGGAGLFSEKVYQKEKLIGYNLKSFDEKFSSGLCFLKDHFPSGLTAGESLGKYLFSEEAFEESARYFEKISAAEKNLFLDEVGRLELGGKGFADLLSILLKSQSHVFLAVRTPFREELIKKFEISDWEEIPCRSWQNFFL